MIIIMTILNNFWPNNSTYPISKSNIPDSMSACTQNRWGRVSCPPRTNPTGQAREVDGALARTLAERDRQDAMFSGAAAPPVKIHRPEALRDEERRKAAIAAILNCTS